jgi:hypothetical protein
VNGILKGRFASLKGLSIQIRELKDFVAVNKWILVCLILHNILIEFNVDEWEHEIETQESLEEFEELYRKRIER